MAHVVTKHDRLAASHDGEDNGLLTVSVGAFGLEHGSAFLKYVGDVLAYRLGVVADNRKVFAKVDIFNYLVDYKGLGHKSGEGEETGGNIEYEASANRNTQIHEEESGTDVETCILSYYHRHDIRSAAACTAVKENRRAYGR